MMTCTHDHIAQQIREKGFRLTPQRVSILNALHSSGGHLSATGIYAIVHHSTPGLTKPTVYRTLDFLVQNQLVRVTHSGNGKLVYELARHQHHHIVCHICGQEQEVSQSQMQAIYDHLEQVTGYRLTEDHLTFTGICSNCKEIGG
jgi:Fe2+ or Zn2+ uptake regulation protein